MADNQQKKKYPLLKTPRCVLVWPKLNIPDTKFDKDGAYRTKALIPSALGLELRSQMEDLAKQAIIDYADRAKPQEVERSRNKGMQLPIEAVLDDAGNSTGQHQLSFKAAATGKDLQTGETYSNKPKIFDSTGKPCDVMIYSGTEAIIAFTMMPWASALGYGVSMRPKAVQVLKLGVKGQRSAGDFGFGTEEDGFSSDDYVGEDTSSTDTPKDADNDVI